MDTKQFLRSILDSLQQIDYVKPEDVPNIDLYMDQVTTFMDSRGFDTLKSKKVPQSLEIGLFFCQIFIFII